MKPGCVVIGGGGHATMVLEALRLQGKVRIVGVTDPDRGRKSVAGVPVLGDDGILDQARRLKIRCFSVGVGSVGDNRPRAQLYRRAIESGLKPVQAIHPSAVVSPRATVGPGTMIFPRAVVNPGSELGANVIVNSAAVVEHDVRIADHAHVCPGAVLCGGVHVGEGAFIGAGAVVIQGVRIGAWAVVAAGAVVHKDVPEGGRVAGIPARPMGKKST
jgi:UDP-perosamine 4-acetyltransferase